MQLDELPTACWDLLCNLCFVGGKAQRHNGTKAQRSDLIVGRMHGWTYFEMLTFFFARHEGITAQRHFSAYRCSNATRRASHSVLGPALQSLFSRGQGTEAQWHKGTKI